MYLLDSLLVGEAGAIPRAAPANAPVLVLGVGNVLMGDEGLGVHVIRRLEAEPEIAGVRLLDGGTGGVNLLAEFESARAIILVDATRDGKPVGEVSYLRPQRVTELPRGLGAHDFGLKDLFAASALTGRMPELHLYTISIDVIRPMCTELSPPVAASLATIVSIMRARAVLLSDEFALRRCAPSGGKAPDCAR